MSIQLRKLRGVISVGLTWGIVWTLLFTLLGFVIGIVDPDSIDPGEEPVIIGLMGGVFGLVSGVVFGTLLAFAESGRAIRNLSLSRAAIWGILGSAVFPLLAGKFNQVLVMCPIGALVAVTLIAIIRKVEQVESEQANPSSGFLFTYLLTPIRDTVSPQN